MQIGLLIWGAVGPLVGVMLGSYLAARGQRKHWFLDNKKQEYRELLSTITNAFTPPWVGLLPDEKPAWAETKKRVEAIILDRLFIAREVKEMDLRNRWLDAASAFDKENKLTAFLERRDAIARDIISAAMRIID